MSASSAELDSKGRSSKGPSNHGLMSAPEGGQPHEPRENRDSAAPQGKTSLPPDQKDPPVQPPLAQPWRRKKPPGTFAGDAAVVQLRTRLASASDRDAGLSSSEFPARAFGGTGQAIGPIVVVMMAAAGFLWGLAPKTPPLSTPPAPASGGANAAQEPFASASNQMRGGPGFGLGASGDAARDAASGATSAAGRPMAAPVGPPTRRTDAAEIAAMMKQGEQFMANADIAGARLVFRRAAEAGDAAAALALAETYDPLALAKSRAKGGITADVAAARRWYEKARDLGSTTAVERIARLAQQ
jgi:hypothetical protein